MNFEVPQISDWNIYRKVHGPSRRSAELSSPYVVVNNGHPTHFWIFLSIWLLTHFWFTVNLSHFFYPFLSNSLEIRIWNLGSIFEFAWVFHSQNHPVFILLHWSFLYIKWGILIWFLLNPRNFQKMWNSIAHSLMYVGILLWDAHLRRHPRKSFKI